MNNLPAVAAISDTLDVVLARTLGCVDGAMFELGQGDAGRFDHICRCLEWARVSIGTAIESMCDVDADLFATIAADMNLRTVKAAMPASQGRNSLVNGR